MNPPIDERLERATESAFGRFIYKVLFPALMVLVGWLGIRAINTLDDSIADLKTSNLKQVEAQVKVSNDIEAIRSQMNYQARYQDLVDQQQNARLDDHDRALRLK